MIRIALPGHLRTLARVDGEVELAVEGPATLGAVLDALEARFPALRGTIRDQVTGQRRPFIRFFACQQDLSHQAPGAPLPDAVAAGAEPLFIVGAIAGGSTGAQAAVDAIRQGDLAALKRILTIDPAIVTVRVDGQRTLLHVATDWPGHFPNVCDSIRLLAAHGADLNAPFQGRHAETPLHWAASSDDVAALDTLLDLGADIEAQGSVIDGGTALADAVAFAQWRAANRLVQRGARSTFWQSAALGLMDRVRPHFAGDQVPAASEVTNAFWNACHGGQLEAARFLLERGADAEWVGHGGLTPLGAAQRRGHREVVEWLSGDQNVS
jgi:hypothetical protein